MSDRKHSPCKEFTDLIAWQEGHKLALAIYELSQTLPAEERFGLTNQVRRASVSVTSNIAEGFGRQTMKDKLRFYSMAHGSLTEIKNQLLLTRDLGFIEKHHNIFEQVSLAQKLLIGLMKATDRQRDSRFSFQHSPQDELA